MVYRCRAFLKKHGEGWHCVKRVDAAGDGNVQRAGDGGKKTGHGPKVQGPLRFVSHQVTGHRSAWGSGTETGVSGRQEVCRWCRRLDRNKSGGRLSARDGWYSKAGRGSGGRSPPHSYRN
ncbi:hypothetical protein IG631_02456 [Alternaria alternata]|nr:hypothetical protein IG631_02456 [Alternaria alternata]